MATPNRLSGSPDPLDRLADPLRRFEELLDQSSQKQQFEYGTARGVAGDASPWLPAAEIKTLRQRLRLTQRQFAGWFGFPAATLRHWERGNRHPTGAALVLLCVIRDNPREVMKAVRRARLLAPGSLPEVEPLESYRAPPGFGDQPQPLRKRRRRTR